MSIGNSLPMLMSQAKGKTMRNVLSKIDDALIELSLEHGKYVREGDIDGLPLATLNGMTTLLLSGYYTNADMDELGSHVHKLLRIAGKMRESHLNDMHDEEVLS